MPNSFLRKIFWFLNRFFMVPIFRMGFAPLMVNPLSGYIMVVKTIGRKSGKLRFSPVNYAIINGCIYCLSGWGQISDWYRNLKANPGVELLLPGGAIAGVAEIVEDTQEIIRAARLVLINGGFAGFMLGFNPYKVTDEMILAKVSDYPVIRIRPIGIGNGSADPGGWLWIPALVTMVVVIILI